MQINDFIRLSYSGKLKEGGMQLDTAENAPIIVGVGYVIKGVDKALLEMNIGDKKTVEIIPEEGFGLRNPKLVRTVPLSEFQRRDTKPYPGMVVEADNYRGRVLTVSGGRVKVDFNHPLAGKILVYDLQVKEKIEKIEEKVKAIVEFYARITTEKVEVHIKDQEIEVITPPMTINSLYKKKISDDIIKFLGFEKIKFSEIYEKPKEEQIKTEK